MKKNPLVSIIIVNWNGGKVFEECLKSLVKIDYPRWELIVVDNGSTDGSEMTSFRHKFKGRRIIIKNKKNVGFAGANNQGYKRVRGNYVLLLNNDTKVRGDLVRVLVEKMQREQDLGVVQPKIRIMDKPDYLDNCGSFLTRTGFLQHWGFMDKNGKQYDSEREVFSTKGACMLIRREVIEKVELFDSDYVSYFEESDFCWRVWMAGYRVLYYPRTEILHKVGFTSKRLNQFEVTLQATKNRIASLYKNLSSVNLLLIFVPHIFILCALGTYYLVRFRRKKSWMIYGAIWWNLTHIRKLVRKRAKVQKMRKIGDRELFEYIMQKVNFVEMLTHFKKVEANFNG